MGKEGEEAEMEHFYFFSLFKKKKTLPRDEVERKTGNA